MSHDVPFMWGKDIHDLLWIERHIERNKKLIAGVDKAKG